MYIYNIDWDTDEEEADLPETVDIPEELEDEDDEAIIDWVSETYGWDVGGFSRSTDTIQVRILLPETTAEDLGKVYAFLDKEGIDYEVI